MSLHDLSAVDLLAAYRTKTLSPVEVVRAVLDRVAAFEPHLKATYRFDPEGALAAALREAGTETIVAQRRERPSHGTPDISSSR